MTQKEREDEEVARATGLFRASDHVSQPFDWCQLPSPNVISVSFFADDLQAVKSSEALPRGLGMLAQGMGKQVDEICWGQFGPGGMWTCYARLIPYVGSQGQGGLR